MSLRPRALSGIAYGCLATIVRAAPAVAQSARDGGRENRELVGEGLKGFADVAFLGQALVTLSLATALGALLAYHPRRRHTVDSVEAADAPKVFVVYAVIGAVIGMMVLKYGLVVGFVVFGIGGLTRFRTDLSSAPDTGRLILITLVGLSCGLDLPHLAVLASVFGFLLLMVLDARATYHVEVKGLERDDVGAAAAAYRVVLEREGCRIVGERKSFAKKQVAFIFHAPYALQREGLVQRLESVVPERLRGVVDWEVD
jgi:hypothetical protein